VAGKKKITAADLWAAMHDTNDGISAITKYQAFLATGKGNPKDDDARIELMKSNLKMVRVLQKDLDKQADELEKLFSKSK
jgi:hypothetical protein